MNKPSSLPPLFKGGRRTQCGRGHTLVATQQRPWHTLVATQQRPGHTLLNTYLPMLLFICSLLFPACSQCLQLTVNLIGVDEKTTQTLTSNLTIHQATKEPKLTIVRIQNLHFLATKQLTDTLEALGFYQAKIHAELTNKLARWTATYSIQPGKPIIIHQTNLSFTNAGATNQAMLKKALTPKLQHGKILNHLDYEETKQNLLILLQEYGYLSAKFTKNAITINTTSYQADIKLIIDTGKQYVFGETKFVDCIYANNLLNRFIPFKKGDPYTSKKLTEFRKNLSDSAMFRKIKILPKPNFTNLNDNQVPINVSLRHSPLNHYSSSLGYGTNTGFRGGLGWQHRIVSPAGHQLSNFVTISKIRKQANVNYMIPGENPGSDRYIIGAGMQQDIIRDQYSQQKELTFTKVKKTIGVQKYYSIKCVQEKFRFAPTMPFGKTKFLLPGAKWIWSNHETEEKTFTHGSRLEVNLQGGIGAFFFTANFIQTEIQGKWITPINEKTRLILMGDLGSTAIKNFANLPLSLRFFAGGDKSVRGFAYHALGPTQLDDNGNTVTVGGKHLLTTTIELERKLISDLSGAIFIDAGKAMNNWDANKLAAGAGVGIRWATPIGAFKLDLARQVAQVQHKSLRIHLNFGMDL